MSAAYSEIFPEVGNKFRHIFKLLFSVKITLKHVVNKKGPRGSGGMLLRKFFKNLHTVVAILVFFEQFSGKLCLSVLPNMMQLCLYIFD